MNEIGILFFFFFQAEDGIRDLYVTGVQTCALPISTSQQRRPSAKQPPEQGYVTGRLHAGGDCGRRALEEVGPPRMRSWLYPGPRSAAAACERLATPAAAPHSTGM